MELSIGDLLQQYGYIGIFFFLVLGIVGLPLPDEIAMTFLGYLCSINKLNLLGAFLSAFGGSVCGITISYVLGKRIGYPFLQKYGKKIFITEKTLNKTRDLFGKHGVWIVFFGYFIPGVRHLSAYVAGISLISFSRFAIFAYTGALFWCSTFIGFGYIMGDRYKDFFIMLHTYAPKIMLFLTPVLIASALIWWRKKRGR